MNKKIVTVFSLLVGEISCIPAHVATPSPYIDQLFTEETAIKTLEQVLNSKDDIYHNGIDFERENIIGNGQIIRCVVDAQEFICHIKYREGYNIQIEKEYTERIKFGGIKEAVCEGEKAIVYPLSQEYFKRNPWIFDFENVTNCQKFIDALTYLKHH